MRGVNKGILYSFPLPSEGHLFWRESKCQVEGVVIFLAGPMEIHLVLWPPTSLTLMFSTNRPIIFSPCSPAPQQDSVQDTITSKILTKTLKPGQSFQEKTSLSIARVATTEKISKRKQGH